MDKSVEERNTTGNIWEAMSRKEVRIQIQQRYKKQEMK
jgi:hypothetical protein